MSITHTYKVHVEQLIYSTSDTHANRFGTMLVLEPLDEYGCPAVGKRCGDRQLRGGTAMICRNFPLVALRRGGSGERVISIPGRP